MDVQTLVANIWCDVSCWKKNISMSNTWLAITFFCLVVWWLQIHPLKWICGESLIRTSSLHGHRAEPKD